MNKENVFNLMEAIKEFYPQFEVTQNKLDRWHLILKDYENQNVMDRLIHYVKANHFPPTISDILQQDKEEPYFDRSIPNVEETQEYLKKLSNLKTANAEFVEKEKQKIKKILDII